MLWRTPAAKRQPLGFIEPCIPTRVSKPPVGSQWSHEIKHDGYRLIVRKDGDRVRLFTRRGFDWTDRYPLITKAAAKLRMSSVTLDGEADLRGTHGTMLLDAGVPVHVVAARLGQDPAVLLRTYAKRTKKADTSAAAVISAMSRGILGQS